MKELYMPYTNLCRKITAKTSLHTLADRLPDDSRVLMLLGLDGDCDFSRKRTRYLPHLCGKEELLTLIDSEPGPELRPVHGLPDYLVLCRRHAVWVPDLMRSETEAG